MMDLLGWENWKNWPAQFEKKHAMPWTSDEILERVRRLEKLHWTYCVFGVVLAGIGGGTLVINTVIGALCLTMGFLLTVSTKLASTACLCTLWDMRQREEEALRQSEIQDL